MKEVKIFVGEISISKRHITPHSVGSGVADEESSMSDILKKCTKHLKEYLKDRNKELFVPFGRPFLVDKGEYFTLWYYFDVDMYEYMYSHIFYYRIPTGKNYDRLMKALSNYEIGYLYDDRLKK